MQRVTATFYGKVQGVGFRAATKSVAQDMGVRGWVKNMPDGTVKLVAEAGRDVLEDFIEHMRERKLFGIKLVEKVEAKYGNATNEFDTFEIRR